MMTYEERVAYVRALMYISTIDEKIEEEELEYLNQVGQLYGIADEELKNIKKSVLKKEESIEQILSAITDRKVQLTLVYELLALCYADNSYDIVEKQGMRNICNILLVEDTKLVEIENAILENIELQKKISTILERE